MPDEDRSSQYEQEIQTYKTHLDLLSLWEQIDKGVTPGWSEGRALEYLIVRAFELEGAHVLYPFGVYERTDETGKRQMIEQIDGTIFTDGFACLIEAKDRVEEEDFMVIAKMQSHLRRRPPAALGLVFSMEGFTPPAIQLTKFTAPQSILLWNGADLRFALEEYARSERGLRWGVVVKYRYLVSKAVPHYALRSEISRSD